MRVLTLTLAAALAACSSPDQPTEIELYRKTMPRRPPIAPEQATVAVGGSVQFTVLPDTAFPAEWRWMSANDIVATVDSLTGIARAQAQGVTVIIARAVADTNIRALGSITVTP